MSPPRFTRVAKSAVPFTRFAAPAILSLVSLALISIGGTSFLSADSFRSKAQLRSLTNSRTQRSETGLTVHEWGTFTSVMGDGHSLIWRPLSVESDLPPFVYCVDKGRAWRGLRYPSKSGLAVSVRMETPVLYFYAKEEKDVSVKVDFLHGKITEWYPQARAVNRNSIDWGKLTIMPTSQTDAQIDLPHDGSENHYYPARETDAAMVRARGDSEQGQTQHEKFLFYRGVGSFDLPLLVRLDGNQVAIKNAFGEKVRKIVIFENSGGQIGYRIHRLRETELVVERPALMGNLEDLRQRMKAILVAEGLFEKEADAMLNTWRDSWFEEGLRVFYVLPRATTDAILPIAIEPQPAELVRVLVG
ncbi:MAG: hypothetical protein ACRD6N_15930, partial [Pyrinomonadaceae bacterium]